LFGIVLVQKVAARTVLKENPFKKLFPKNFFETLQKD
jgi:hypothetical protein